MNTATLTTRGFGLKQVLVIDALTCLVCGLALVGATGFLSALFGLPEGLLRYAGLILFPCAALMWVAARKPVKLLVWTVILGNFAWALASVVVAFALEPTFIGFTLTLVQAGAVATLGLLEWRAVPPQR